MAKIFLSYRRDDSSGYAGRLYDRLRNHFGSEQIFMDVSGIEAGADFVQTIHGTVGSCDVLIALLGKQWLSSKDQDGRRRLDDPDDFVRQEIATALERKILVVPVLVGGARMPAAQELPADLAGPVRRQALEISDSRFHEDANRLIGTLEKAFSGLKAKDTAWPPKPLPPAGEFRAESETETSTDAVPKSSQRKASSLLLGRRWILAISLVLIVAAAYVLQRRTPPGDAPAPKGTLGSQVDPADTALSATLQRDSASDKLTKQEKALPPSAPEVLQPQSKPRTKGTSRQRTDSGAAPATIQKPVEQAPITADTPRKQARETPNLHTDEQDEDPGAESQKVPLRNVCNLTGAERVPTPLSTVSYRL